MNRITVDITGITFKSQIYESVNSLVYRGFRESDGQPIILKMLKQDYPTPDDLSRYQREYEITRQLNLEGVVKVYDLQNYQNTLVILLEDFGGESLKRWLSQKPFSLSEFLPIALQITQSLGQVHHHNIIHKDINPSNLVFNPQTGQVKLIDFGISTVLARENPSLTSPQLLEGTLAYISPEQTGRMNRSLDYRTDFYSLGVTFYELLTHQLPFQTEEALELVHCHIAKQPVPPHVLEPDIPKIISDIVMKLMAKTAEERYQSAWGIHRDLAECWHQLQHTGKISTFLLASADISSRFQIPQKLYGREREVEVLLRAFERVATGEIEVEKEKSEALVSQVSPEKSHIEMMLVAGYSGIGKSVLVQELYKPITQKRGYFIRGKFDPFQRDVPYSAVIQSLTELVRQVLTESEAELQQWRDKLLQAFGANGQVIIDVIPEVELIVGSQSPVPTLGATESQNRFNLVFQNFIKVFGSKKHPLVIFIDDLQWADSATLKLIKLMMTEGVTGTTGEMPTFKKSQHLFFIGAYRDNEVNSIHPLAIALEEMRQQGAIINQITLAPLELKHITDLIADTLHSDLSSVKSLAELVLRKTGGNPFFSNEFLKTLYAENLIRFNLPATSEFESNINHPQNSPWSWDIEQIQAISITDNVLELMLGKLKKLPEFTQQVLRLAACVGFEFDLKTLSIICEKSTLQVSFELIPAIQSELILAISQLDSQLLIQKYKFSHDRIQQAAYALINEEDKKIIHLQIGRLLLQNAAPDGLSEKIFKIVDHFNMGIEMITKPEERDKIAKLNLRAGQRAKAATAYGVAIKYLNAGFKLLPDNSWETQYELALDLHIEAVEVEYLNTNYERSAMLSAVVKHQAKTLLEKVRVYEIEIQSEISQNKLQEALQTGLQVIKMLGVSLPHHPNKLNFWSAQFWTKLQLLGKPIADLKTLPFLIDSHKIAAMRILMNLAAPAYNVNPALLPLVALKMVNLCIEYGNSPWAAYAYGLYGLMLCNSPKTLDSGYRFGQLSLRILEQFDARELKSKVFQVFNSHVRFWKEPLRETIIPLQETVQAGLETGEVEYAGYASAEYCIHLFFSGENLEFLEQKFSQYGDLIEKINQDFSSHYINIWRQLGLKLLDPNLEQYSLIGECFNETEMLPIFRRDNTVLFIFSVYLAKTLLCYLFKNKDEALENARLAERYKEGSVGLFKYSVHNFYYSLVLLSHYPQFTKKEQRKGIQLVSTNQKLMKHWAKHAPCNFQHKYELVEAEKAKVLGKKWQAAELYKQAIQSARKNGYIQEEALAYELAAEFYLDCGMEEIAQTYMTKAYYGYSCWQALAKVKDLEKRYPQLISKSVIANRRKNTITKTTSISTSSRSIESLDLASVMKASQAISGEIILDKLLASLMKILIENAGAQKGLLILETEGKRLIEASGDVGLNQVTVLQSLPVENSVMVSSTIINYVARTQESVLLNDATHEGQFTLDPYIKAHQPKSILCVPLINQGKLISIVYLENNLTTGAFTPERLALLKLLSSQAAISIENAKLYTEVRASESRLNQFLEGVPVGVAVFDTTGKPCYSNRITYQLFGKGVIPETTIEEISKIHHVYKAGTAQEYPTEKLPAVRALKGESVRINDIEIHREDKIIPIETWGTPIYDEKGNIAYAIVALQDITERKKAEIEREKFTAKLFQLNQSFSRFVPRQFLQLLDKESIIDVQLGDAVQQEMSVLFSDIRDFTTLSERMTPQDNFKFINAYLSRMEPAIIEHQGFIDKYIGDAIMALFSGEADNALKAGISMLHRLTEYNQQRMKSGYMPIQIGIGINTGSLMLGTVGGYNRMDGTVISDAVNLASRVENLTKNYGVSLLITHQTFLQLNEPVYAIRPIDRVKVKGKSEVVAVYEVFDADPPEVREGKLTTFQIFIEALHNYNSRHFRKAKQLFSECLRLNPRDKVAQIYQQRCQ
ncbi:protein kinase domain-containing protein [Allocoleopsis franciscana]|uniref:PAS domain S-box n=1 Tax=Allocoleopsis franciscana PCC 7113 TaxID=1173027 RepID=K9WH54_9CYAN|nr:AAA family ATPase [Allocoleopsis franciscana]AFZ19745.1 PAS domain S-box [Allocoleopsis franciscana PCC 7113]